MLRSVILLWPFTLNFDPPPRLTLLIWKFEGKTLRLLPSIPGIIFKHRVRDHLHSPNHSDFNNEMKIESEVGKFYG